MTYCNLVYYDAIIAAMYTGAAGYEQAKSRTMCD